MYLTVKLPRGCYYADTDGNSFFKEPSKILDMVSASGAGDAFTAGLVYSFLQGYGPEKMIGTAQICGSRAVLSRRSVIQRQELD